MGNPGGAARAEQAALLKEQQAKEDLRLAEATAAEKARINAIRSGAQGSRSLMGRQALAGLEKRQLGE